MFLSIKFYFVSQEAAEATEFHINWLLLVTPLLLIFAVKLLSSFQGRRKSYGGCSGGRWSSPSGSGSCCSCSYNCSAY
ncbi:hypothetical protein SOVF_172450 [Spinacia oleracea]|nr:hypothetical protein SOVF_172450 [Spinacia oleracea]